MVCGKTETKLSQCAACKVVYYCCVAHQTEDWPIHKGVCQVLRKGTVSKENVLKQRKENLILELTHYRKTVYFSRMKTVRKLGDGNFSEIHLVNDSLLNRNYA